MFGVAEDDGGVAFFGMEADFACDDADVGAGGVFEFDVEGLEVVASFGGDAVGADDEDGVIFMVFVNGEVGLGLVVANFVDALGFEFLHHLTVMDEGAVGEDGFGSLVCEFAGDIDGAFNAPAEAGALGANDFYIFFGYHYESR